MALQESSLGVSIQELETPAVMIDIEQMEKSSGRGRFLQKLKEARLNVCVGYERHVGGYPKSECELKKKSCDFLRSTESLT
jgi:hypothetical protein